MIQINRYQFSQNLELRFLGVQILKGLKEAAFKIMVYENERKFFTKRERGIIDLLKMGLTNKAIAEKLAYQ
ncbi:MAG: hypothetical protein U5K51_02295 [Flavobacteriaceae bacterium]|nr:hypothetical protein [Flavobacteriaceae bacterium]